METLTADLRLALRSLARAPGFAAAAIGILALGIAANTAVFSVADAVLFRPLAFYHAEQLVLIDEVLPRFSHLYPRLPVNAKHFLDWKARTHSFQDLAIYRDGGINLTGNDGPPERLGLVRTSANLLSVLRVPLLLGRNFTAEEDRPGSDRVVILSEPLWRRRFHSDPKILNAKILLNGVPNVVVGVLPEWFRFPRPNQLSIGGGALPVELFKPLALEESQLGTQGDFNYTVIARLRSGVTRGQALAELNALQAALSREYEPGPELRADVDGLQDRIVAGSRRGLLVLLGAIGAVLLIVCVNLGNLMLARTTARWREMAVRSALGAGSWRIVRQVLTESLLISSAGGVLGFALACVAVRAFLAAAPVDVPRLDEVQLHFRAVLFAFAVSAASEGRHGLRISEILVSAEVALSAALLAAAGLLVGSLFRILAIDPGFRPENVLTVTLNLSSAKYRDEKQLISFVDRALASIQSLPGVRAAGSISALPLQGETWVDPVSRDDDHRPIFERPMANYRSVSPEYFDAMQIPIVRGRAFEPADRDRHVVIVSARTAARVWPGGDAIGKHARRASTAEPFYEVVGVVADVRADMKTEPPLMVYRTYWQAHNSMAANQAVVIRTSEDAASMAAAVRKTVWAIDSDMPVPEMKTMRQIVTASTAQRRFHTMLLGGFALAALLLAAIGIYGVISYAVNRRRGEIGIRMALGADAGQVSRMVLREGLRPVAIGLLAGLATALSLGRLLESLLYEIRASNPVVLAAVALALAAAAVPACYIPARRATAVDPATILRYE